MAVATPVFGLHPHTLRHGFWNAHAGRGRDLRAVQNCRPRASLHTQRYTQLSVQHLMAVYDKTPKAK